MFVSVDISVFFPFQLKKQLVTCPKKKKKSIFLHVINDYLNYGDNKLITIVI